MKMRKLALGWATTLSVLLAACGGGDEQSGTPIRPPSTPAPSPSPSATMTRVSLQSDAGDYIGAGGGYEYTKADATIAVTISGARVSVNIDGDESWFGDFQIPNASVLTAGTYAGAQRYPFNAAGTPGLSWSGEGRGCNTLTGSFTITDATYVGGVLTSLDLDFVQHCEGGAAALRGEVHWRSADATVPPGPAALPSNLWAPAAGATPATGNYIYLTSQAGDYIGGGQSYLYTPGSGTLSVASGGARLEVSVAAGSDFWSADFQGMNVISQLQPGYYGDLQRYPFHNPTKGGLSWYGNGRGCNRLTGWFVVDSVSYSNGALTAIDLRFEQHCEGLSPALRGKIHWVQ